VSNLDAKTVQGFGDEWSRFDQSALPESELRSVFAQYFANFPWKTLPSNAVGFDLGCGSGRWAKLAAERVGSLHCIDASNEALQVAKRKLSSNKNCKFHHASVDNIPLPDESMDFGYSLGVLHHVPDTAAGIRSCVAKLKRGAPFLVYLYYRFDNRPLWFRSLWRSTEALRYMIARMPPVLKHAVTDFIALTVYWPLARFALVPEWLGANVESLPLAAYRRLSVYTMRTDSRDRFGTRLEQRFTRAEIQAMMQLAGLENIVFNEATPYWCAVGTKK